MKPNAPSMHVLPLHHGAEPATSGFDAVTVIVLIGALLVLAGIIVGAWFLLKRIRGL